MMDLLDLILLVKHSAVTVVIVDLSVMMNLVSVERVVAPLVAQQVEAAKHVKIVNLISLMVLSAVIQRGQILELTVQI
jgi:hypothetical protein